MALTVTPGHRVTPPPVSLADGPVAGARERHPLLASAMRLRCDDPGTDVMTRDRCDDQGTDVMTRDPEPHLKVTTAWRVVLLPSSQPFGRMPGDPQLISGKHNNH